MAVIFDSILGKLRQENGNASSESKIIHVITVADVLLLEDDIDYYNRMKNLLLYIQILHCLNTLILRN